VVNIKRSSEHLNALILSQSAVNTLAAIAHQGTLPLLLPVEPAIAGVIQYRLPALPVRMLVSGERGSDL
jgi:hypothetical protein